VLVVIVIVLGLRAGKNGRIEDDEDKHDKEAAGFS
jgi:hypothetical protein